MSFQSKTINRKFLPGLLKFVAVLVTPCALLCSTGFNPHTYKREVDNCQKWWWTVASHCKPMVLSFHPLAALGPPYPEAPESKGNNQQPWICSSKYLTSLRTIGVVDQAELNRPMLLLSIRQFPLFLWSWLFKLYLRPNSFYFGFSKLTYSCRTRGATLADGKTITINSIKTGPQNVIK